jgi:hypothetical protein
MFPHITREEDVTKVKKIKAVLGKQKTSDGNLIKDLVAVYDGMNGNTQLPNSPVDMPTYKAAIDAYTVYVANAADGGKKAISAMRKQREAVIKMYTLIGHYVEGACNDDPAIFATSGFVAVSTTRTPAGPLGPSTFEWIDRGDVSGQIVFKPKTQPEKVLHYEVRFGVSVSGAAPTSWTEIPLPSPKKYTVSNLTPGATYAFQIRAYGPLGYNDWSDSMTFICG